MMMQLQLLEEKHSFSEKHFPKPETGTMEPGDQCKRLSNALQEVHYKGTLIERLEMLEERVLKVYLKRMECKKIQSQFKITNWLALYSPILVLLMSKHALSAGFLMGSDALVFDNLNFFFLFSCS